MKSNVIKQIISKKGNTVVFRYPTKEDFADMFSFACDIGAEDTTILLDRAPTEEEEHDFFNTMIRDVEANKAIYIMAYVNGLFVGNGRVMRKKYRESHIGDIGISLRAKYRDEGIGTELMGALIVEAKTLGLRLLTLGCFENNTRALHVYEKLGFKRVGVIPGAIFYKGEYLNKIQYYLPL